MLEAASLLLATLFSLIGLAFFVYGKKQTEPAFLAAGGLLMVYPFFITAAWPILLLGLLLTAAPFVARRWGG